MKINPKRFLVSFVSLSALMLAGVYSILPARAQTISCPQPITYGTLTVGCGGGSTATIYPDGTRGVTGCLTGGAGPYSNGLCTVSQSFPFQNIQISVPAGAVITRTAGTQTMPLNSFNLVTNGNGSVYSTTAPFASIPVGATVNAGASPVSGTYQGSITVNAVFN